MKKEGKKMDVLTGWDALRDAIPVQGDAKNHREVPESEIKALAEIRQRTGISNLRIFRDQVKPIVFQEGMLGEPGYRPACKIMVCPYGNYFLFGEADSQIINDEFIDKMISSFKSNIRGQMIPVDEDHWMQEAYGWITDLVRESDGLWANCELTPIGRQKIQDKEYLYSSMAYFDKYINPNTRQAGENVLISLAVTNYPALKGIKPIMTQHGEIREDIPNLQITQVSELEGSNKANIIKSSKEEISMDAKTVENLQSEVAQVKSNSEEVKKTVNEHIAKLQGELEAEKKRVEMQQEELAKLKAESFKKEMNRRFESLMPQAGQETFHVPAELMSEVIAYGEKHLKSEEDLNDFMTLMEKLPGVRVDLKTYGSSEAPKDKMSDDQIAEKAMKLAEADAGWSNKSDRTEIYKRYEAQVKAGK